MPSKVQRRPPILTSLLIFIPALACVALAVPATHPLMLIPLLLAQTLAMAAVCRALGFGAEGGFASAVVRRGSVHMILLVAWTVWVWLLIAWPLLLLMRAPSLGASLLLSVALALALAPLWRLWPMFGLAWLWEDAYPEPGSHSWIATAIARSIAFSIHLTRRPEHLFSHVLPAGLALLSVTCAALLLSGLAEVLPPEIRHAGLLVYGVALLPLASLVLAGRSLSALVDERSIRRDGRGAAGHGSAAASTPGIVLSAQERAPGAREAGLIDALRAGDSERALALLTADADPDTVPDGREQDRRSALNLAVTLPDTRVLRAMIGKGADIHRSHAGASPLLAAIRDCYHGRAEAVTVLLANGADARLADAEGNTPLHFAARSADPGIAAILLDAGAEIEALNHAARTPLAVACRAANHALMQFLLEHDARPEPELGEPALLATASADADDVEGTRLLLKHKARPNARDALQRTALMAAALEAHPGIVATLLDAGAQVNLVDQRGTTALMEAARAGADDVLSILATQRPGVGLRDSHGRDALILACQSPRAGTETVRILLALGADPKAGGGDQRSALDHACASGRWNLVALLDPTRPLPASHCADVTPEPDADSPTHLLLALRAGRWAEVSGFTRRVREWLPSERANLYLQLASAGHAGARRWLLDHGLDANDLLADGRRLFDALLELLPQSIEAVEDLLRAGAEPAAAGGLSRAMARTGQAAGGAALIPELISRGADLFGADEHGRVPLHHAAATGTEQALRLLLARGCDPNVRDLDGSTPLHHALERGTQACTPLVRMLISHGANPEAAGGSGETPLGLALDRGDSELVAWLRWSTWPLPGRILHADDLPAAAATGDSEAVSRLLELGFAVDACDGHGASALLRACGGGHLETATRLLEAGADTGRAAHSGATPLSAAVSARRTALVRLLIEHGADLEQGLPGGATALLVSAAMGLPDIAELLLVAGADVSATDSGGHGALHAACQFGFGTDDSLRARRMLDVLIARGARPDLPDRGGARPLLFMLGAHAKPGSRCDATHIGALLPVLLDAGASADGADHRGVTPLHACAMHALMAPARILIARGADREARDNHDRTAADVARLLGYVDVAHELGGRDIPGARRTLRQRADPLPPA